MAEAVASAVIGDVVSRVISFVTGQVENQQSVQENLQKVRYLLVKIQSVVEEAEGRQVTNLALLEWLSELINGMYQGRYLVDTFQSGTVEHTGGLDDEAEPRSFSPSSFNPAKRIRVAAGCVRRWLFHDNSVNELNGVLENLQNISSDLREFIMLFESYPPIRRPITTNIYVDSQMFGRHIEREIIISFLLQDSSLSMESFGVLPIIGDRRVGKTTLVQHVCDDIRVRNHFSAIILFDFVYTYLMANSESRTEHQYSKFVAGDMRNFNDQLNVLKHMLSANRFLIVFENVDLHKVEMLRVLLQTLRCDKQGSKIIVTSDKNHIVSMGTVKPIKLMILPQAEYWFFFKAHAFAGADIEEDPRMVAIGKSIAKGLQGSFLGAKIVGAMRRAHPNPRFWSKFLRSDIGELSLFGDGLGYMYDVAEVILPSHVRVCRVAASAWLLDCPARTLVGLQDLSSARTSAPSRLRSEVNLQDDGKDSILHILLCKSVFPFYSVYYTALCTLV